MTYGDSEEEVQEIKAIDDLDLSVQKGEFIAILGRNGSGKSSLAKHINGLLMPTEGAVYVKGMDTREHSQILKIRQSAGIVFQNPDNQIVGTIVEEDVAFGPENMGKPVEDIWRRVTKALSDVGMLAYKESSPNRLSGGQKQRIAIARALIARPQIILADEPTGALDSKTSQEVMDLLKEVNREGMTLVVVTHERDIATQTNKIVHIKDGIIGSVEILR